MRVGSAFLALPAVVLVVLKLSACGATDKGQDPSPIADVMAKVGQAESMEDLREATIAGFRSLLDFNRHLAARVEDLEQVLRRGSGEDDAARSPSSAAASRRRKLEDSAITQHEWEGWTPEACDSALEGENPRYLLALKRVCCDGDAGERNSAICTPGSFSRRGCNQGCSSIFWPTYTHCLANHPKRTLSWKGSDWKANLGYIAEICPVMESLGQCSVKQLSDWIAAVKEACCSGDSCKQTGYPTKCDGGCATLFWPTFIRCVQPHLLPDGSARNPKKDQGLVTAFRQALGGVKPEAWMSLANKCQDANKQRPAPPPPATSNVTDSQFLTAKFFKIDVGLDDGQRSRRSLQGHGAEMNAHEDIINSGSREINKLAAKVPKCMPRRQGYFLAATIDGVDTMLFCARSNIGWAWEGFADLGGYFGNSWVTLADSMRSKAQGTFFLTMKNSNERERVIDTVTVGQHQQAFITGKGASQPELHGSPAKAAFLVETLARLQLSFVAVSDRTAFAPAGMHVQSGAMVDILGSAFKNLHTTGPKPTNAVLYIESNVHSLTAGGSIRVETSSFQNCGPIAISAASPVAFKHALFAQNGDATTVAASVALHNVSISIHDSVFKNNLGDAMRLESSSLVLLNTTFSTNSADQGTAINLKGDKAKGGSSLDATKMKIDRYSQVEFDQYSHGKFASCYVQNPTYTPMNQRCTFDAAKPRDSRGESDKLLCRISHEPIKFGGFGATTVDNQVYRQVDIRAADLPGPWYKTPFLGEITVRTGYTVNITAEDPVCRNDPARKLEKFASLNNDDHYCATVMEHIHSIIQITDKGKQWFNASGGVDCSKTLLDVEHAWPDNYFNGGLIDFDKYCETPHSPTCYRTEGAPALGENATRLEQICRRLCGRCVIDGKPFSAKTMPAAASLQPRLLLDGVFRVEKAARLLLNNVAIRDGLCPACKISDMCPLAAQTCADDYKTPAVLLANGAQLQAGFTQIADIHKPEWGWLVKSCSFRQRQAVSSNQIQPQDVCAQRVPAPTQNSQSGTVMDRSKQIHGPKYQSCEYTLQVDPSETLVLKFSRSHHSGTLKPDDYTISVFCGCKDNSRNGDCAGRDPSWSSDHWKSGNSTTYSCKSHMAVIKRLVILPHGDNKDANDAGWTLDWGVQWDLAYKCLAIPPDARDQAPLTGPADIRRNGVYFVKVPQTTEQSIKNGRPPSLRFAKPLKVQSGDRLVVYGEATTMDTMTTIHGRFVVAPNATLTAVNIVLDPRPFVGGETPSKAPDGAYWPALTVAPQASVTIKNCGVSSAPAIQLPSGAFSMKQTILSGANPVDWDSRDLNFIYQSLTDITQGQKMLQIFQDVSLVDPKTQKCRAESPDCTLHISNGQKVDLRGPKPSIAAADLRIGLKAFINVAAGGELSIRYLRLTAPSKAHHHPGIIQIDSKAMLTIANTQLADKSTKNCRVSDSKLPRSCWSWIVQDLVDRNVGFKSRGTSPSDSTLKLAGPLSIFTNTSVLRLFSATQNKFSSTLQINGTDNTLHAVKTAGATSPDTNILDEQQVQKYPEFSDKILLSTSFQLGPWRSAVYIGKDENIENVPSLLEYKFRGSYYVLQFAQEAPSDIVFRNTARGELSMHVLNGQDLRLVTTTHRTVIHISGTALKVAPGGSVYTSLVAFPSLSVGPKKFSVRGQLETDACLMSILSGGNTYIEGVTDKGSIVCRDLNQFQGTARCNHGVCWSDPSTACGNHVIEVAQNEQCDLGSKALFPKAKVYNSKAPNAVCREDCTFSKCGDAIVDKGEECDVGDIAHLCKLHPVPDDPRYATCAEEWLAPSICEDSLGSETCKQQKAKGCCEDNSGACVGMALQCRKTCAGSRQELCRALNSNRTDSCRADCKKPACGDGITDSHEQCDPGCVPGSPSAQISWAAWAHLGAVTERGQCPVCSDKCSLCQQNHADFSDLQTYLLTSHGGERRMVNGSLTGPTWYNMSICKGKAGSTNITIQPSQKVKIGYAKPGTGELEYSMRYTVLGQLVLSKLHVSKQHYSGTDFGGAIIVRSQVPRRSLTIKGCTIEENAVSSNGGALAVTKGNVEVVDSGFSNNQADGDGGAIWVSASGSARLKNVVFSGNKATGNGGAIWAAPSTIKFAKAGDHLSVIACTFKLNTATYGGAVYPGTGARLANDDGSGGDKPVGTHFLVPKKTHASGKKKPASGTKKPASGKKKPASGKTKPASGTKKPEESGKKKPKESGKEKPKESGKKKHASGTKKHSSGKKGGKSGH